MERNVLMKLAVVWGVMLVTLIIMVIQSPVNPIQQAAPAGTPTMPDMFGQVKQFMSDMQSNITPPKGLS